MAEVYQWGAFRPIREEREQSGLTIHGRWPRDLAGTLYRVGPNPQFPPIEPYNPLLGDGMVHAFRIADGSVSYRNRWVRTRQWQLEHAAGRALFATSGDPRQHDPLVAGEQTDGVANTSLVRHGGRLLVLEEGNAPMEIDPVSLETRGVWRFNGRLAHNMTAHPKIDPQTGEMVFFANEPDRRFTGSVCCYVANARGEITFEQSVQTPFASVIHDFAVTAEHIVLIVCPVVISLSRARAGGPVLAFEPQRSTHVGVLRRDGAGEVRWLTADACFVWHVGNAWREGDRIAVDLCEQAAPAFPLADGSATAPSAQRQYPARWWIPAGGAERIDRTIRSTRVCEYPRIDDRFAMRETRHGYFACHGGPGTGDPFHRGVAHLDGHTARMSWYRFAADQVVSEPVFVPRSPGAEEGEGWLLCLVYDGRDDRSHLAVFDAADLEAGPVARALLPWRVPMGFHGLWIPAGG